MTTQTPTDVFEIFLAGTPGLEDILLQEARAIGFADAQVGPGGVTLRGGWQDVWRANLSLRCATRVLARFAGFPVFHLAQLDKRARKVDWRTVLRPDLPVRVDVTSRRSKVYHAGAAKQRIETALREAAGIPVANDAALLIKARIDDNYCTFSVDTSGDSLHKRGHKEAVGKAPLRETLAASFLRQCGFDGEEPVLDPMCGSGTFLIEAAEMARGLAPGRSRSFAFEDLASFDAAAWAALRAAAAPREGAFQARGFDRDQGAVAMATANAARAGVGDLISFACQPVSALARPGGSPGLVMVNPPYGARIGNKKMLYGLYATLGERLLTDFQGWRVGLVTSEAGLARATALPFAPPGPPVPLGGLKIRFFQTGGL